MYTPTRYIPCDKCRGKVGPRGQPGFYYVDEDNKRFVTECTCHKYWIEENRRYIEAERCGIWTDESSLYYSLPPSYRGEKSKGTITKITKYIDSLFDSYAKVFSLYLTGVSGTQKTTVAQYIGLNFFEAKMKAYFLQMQPFIRNISNPYGIDEEEGASRKKFMKVVEGADCLIIDNAFEKDASPVYGGNQSSYIEGFLRERMEVNHKAVIFVSKVAPNEIKKQGYSESLQEFVIKQTTNKGTQLEFLDIFNDFEVSSIFKDK